MSNASINFFENNGIPVMHIQKIGSRMGSTLAEPHTSTTASTLFMSEGQIDLHLRQKPAGNIQGVISIEDIHKRPDIPFVFSAGVFNGPPFEQAKITVPCSYPVNSGSEQEQTASLEKALYRYDLDHNLKENQIDIKKSETQFQHLFENAPMGIFRTTLDGKVLAVNTEMARMIGCETPGEAIRDFTDLADKLYVNPGRRREFISLLKKNGVVKHFEYQARKKNREIIWVSMDARLIPGDENEEYTGEEVIEGFVKDITESKQLENVQAFLAQTSSGTTDEPFFNSLVRYLAQFLDMDFVRIYLFEKKSLTARTMAVWCRDYFEDNANFSLAKTQSGQVADKMICYPAGVGKFFSINQKLLEIGAESCVGMTLKSHNGLPIGQISVIGKKPLINRSFVEDVLKLVAVRAAGELDRIEVEDALRKSEEQYRRIVDTAREGIWALDKNWQTTFVNPHMAAMLGYEPVEMLGRVIDDFIHENDLADHSRRKHERQQGKDGQYERRFRGKDGHTIWTIVSSTAQMDNQDQFAGSFAMFTNITKRKNSEVEKDKIQAQLVHAQKMESIGRLAGGVAHDFNNMLSVIIGNTELALRQIKKESKIRKELEEIKNAALRSADLTRQLLAFARKQTVAPKTIDLNHAIEGMLKMLHRLIGEDITLDWLPQRGLRSVFVDPSQVDQILVNLSVNARDAIRGVGKITIKTEDLTITEDSHRKNTGAIPGEYILLSFTDNGCGIPKEHLIQVFEPFFTTKKHGEGTGLGLSMIYGIVKQNGGFINIDSAPGKGTHIRIYLPHLGGESGEVKPSERTAIPQGQGETILLVEDEKAVLDLNSRMLELLGYCVLATTSTAEAIDMALEYRSKIRILITDIVMPDMNGYDLAHKLWKIKPHLKCLFVSGYTSDTLNSKGFLPKGIHFLQKPFIKRDFAVKIREILAGK